MRPKPTKAKTEIIKLDQFEKLCNSVTPEAGLKFEKKGGQRIGTKNLFRDYLIDVWSFAMYSGCRPEEIVFVRLKNIKEKHIALMNYKVSRAKKIEVLRVIPISSELIE